jgi:hypothetical protein
MATGLETRMLILSDSKIYGDGGGNQTPKLAGHGCLKNIARELRCVAPEGWHQPTAQCACDRKGEINFFVQFRRSRTSLGRCQNWTTNNCCGNLPKEFRIGFRRPRHAAMNLVYSTALRFSGNPEHAEEISQAALLPGLLRIIESKQPCNACGFLFSIVKLPYMKIPAGVPEQRTNLKLLILALCVAASPAAARGTELYNLDFTPPDSGTYQVTLGNPTVQSSVGPFTDALVFHAVTSGEQIRLPIAMPAPEYDLQFDLFAHNLANSDYSFGVFLDGTTIRSVNVHGGLNSVYVYQANPFLNLSLMSLTNDATYHLDVLLDLQSSVWSVAVNGTSLFNGPLGGAGLQDVRFGIAPWIGGAVDAANTYVALDNVLVATVPEPSVVGLAAAGILLWLQLRHRRFQARN